ncbi:DUF4200 domain-containing protein [Flavivirga abyssicola]|uniref:DUF4200 domain-containing protein n=1 Tax=Flavivirga abyssicola TaxID=3063533 RepID=UPI0026E031F5|nr:DUF4200 domain-containing protein [Flavivirga sp. MEBiC07777]WVK15255.1 DUF4200 domain-containing protein [Flavivirga sp. MEBiC07777]
MKQYFKYTLIFFASFLLNSQEATSYKYGTGETSRWIMQGGSIFDDQEPAIIFLNGMTNDSFAGDVNISSGDKGPGIARRGGNVNITSSGIFDVSVLGLNGPDKIFSFHGHRSDGAGTVKFGIGTNSPSMTLELSSLADYDGIKIEDLFKIRRSQLTDNNFVLEHTAPNGNLFIRSRNSSSNTITGDLILNDYGGNVGIGTTDTKGFRLGVKGDIAAEEVKVALHSNWSDFVFDDDYKLPTLTEVENHISKKGHLKDIPSAEEVNKYGIFLGEMDAKLLQKIEELTLYTIQQEKEIEKLKSEVLSFKKLEKEIEIIKNRLETLKK